jgi:hypothetical protein
MDAYETTIPPDLATDLARTAPEAHPDIIDLHRTWDADPRTALTRKDCQVVGGWGQTTQIAKEQSGALRSFLDGKKRLITTSSFYRHLIDRLITAHPARGPKRRRRITPQERAALERANDRRHLEKLAREEAAKAASA